MPLRTFGNDVYGLYGRELMKRIHENPTGLPGIPLPPRLIVENETLPDEPIGILGAGESWHLSFLTATNHRCFRCDRIVYGTHP